MYVCMYIKNERKRKGGWTEERNTPGDQKEKKKMEERGRGKSYIKPKPAQACSKFMAR